MNQPSKAENLHHVLYLPLQQYNRKLVTSMTSKVFNTGANEGQIFQKLQSTLHVSRQHHFENDLA